MQTGILAATFHNEIESIRVMFIDKYRPNYLTPAHFIPGAKAGRAEKGLRGQAMTNALLAMCVR